jgi:hypothetical protein
MAITPISSGLLEKPIAAKALVTLNREAIFPQTVTTNFSADKFQTQGDQVTTRIAIKRPAQDIDPRLGAAVAREGQYYDATVTMEKLWCDLLPIYGHDPSQSIERYVAETGEQAGIGIATSNDDYMYGAFRNWQATTGVVVLGKNSPVAIVANCDATGNFVAFDNSLVRAAGTALDLQNVPDRDNNRFLTMGSVAKGDFSGDTTRITGFAAGLQGSGQYILNGIPQSTYFPAYGFNVGASNVITNQNGLTLITGGTGTQADQLPLGTIAANTDFKDGQEFGQPAIGAISFTLTAGANNTLSPNAAIGQIAQIRNSAGVPKAHFVILRIINPLTTTPTVVGIPYTLKGQKMTVGAFVNTDLLRIPFVPAVNVAHHRAGIIMVNRLIQEPSPGSGAVAGRIVDPRSGLVVQIMRGGYDLKTVSELLGYYMLTTTQFINFKMGVLALSQ